MTFDQEENAEIVSQTIFINESFIICLQAKVELDGSIVGEQTIKVRSCTRDLSSSPGKTNVNMFWLQIIGQIISVRSLHI